MIDALKVKLAKNIAQWAKDNNMTQAEVGVFLNTTQPRVNYIINLKLEGISLEALLKYTEELGFVVTLNIE